MQGWPIKLAFLPQLNDFKRGPKNCFSPPQLAGIRVRCQGPALEDGHQTTTKRANVISMYPLSVGPPGAHGRPLCKE